MTDKVYSTRLTDEEEKHLNKYWSQFSDFIHAAFKKDIDLTQNNLKKTKIQTYATNAIYLCLGAMFLFYTMSITNLLAQIISFLIGIFIIIYGSINIFLDRDKGEK